VFHTQELAVDEADVSAQQVRVGVHNGERLLAVGGEEERDWAARVIAAEQVGVDGEAA
jgi:hypothetical protein